MQRLASLHVSLLTLSSGGEAQPVGEVPWLVRLIIQSPQFISLVRKNRQQLSELPGRAVELWPGLWLVAMPAATRRRQEQNGQHAVLPVVMITGRRLIDADQLRHACDHGRVDYQATVAKIDGDALVTDNEAQRLATTITWLYEDAGEIDKRFNEIHGMSKELAESYEELSLLYKLSANMTLNQSPEMFLTEACQELQQVVGLKWLVLRLIDDEPRLQDVSGQLFYAGPVGCDETVLRHISRRLIDLYGLSDHPVIIDDSKVLGIPTLTHLAESLLIVPLRNDDGSLGILFGGDKIGNQQISSIDSKLCDSLANNLSIFLDNMMLYEDVQAMFLGTLHALTSAIDAKDSYTCGHSERVALMSRLLAVAAGLDEPTVEQVYISGLIHDVGKIGVPEAVLCKPGKLSKEEFDLMKLHPEIGARILKDIRQMQNLIPGVLYHHERWEGGGYPYGVAGETIPLFGRLVALADSFDAMSSNRTYRRAMEHKQVLEEIRRCSGTQFDPELAERFLGLDFTQYFRLIEKHQYEHSRRSA